MRRKQIAWLGWVRSGRAPAKIGRFGLGSTRPSLARLNLARLGLGRPCSSRVGLDWPGPALISSAQHAVAAGLLRPVLLSSARLGTRLGSFSRYCTASAAESHVTDKKKFPGQLSSILAWLHLARFGCSSAEPGPARLGLALLGSRFLGLAIGRLGWAGLGSDQLGFARLGRERLSP